MAMRLQLTAGVELLEDWAESATQAERNVVYEALFAVGDGSAFLVRLSGRQMKRSTTATAPAILAGLWVYLAMLDALDEHTADELRAMKGQLNLINPDTG